MLTVLAFLSITAMPEGISGAATEPPFVHAEARMSRPPPRWRGITVAIPDAAPAIDLPPIEGPQDPKRPLVVIDAGHGGHDPGAINPNNGWREKDVTLAIARAVRDELLKGGRIRVAMTRSEDDFLILQERYGIARRLGAGLFVSIHADAAPEPEVHGASVYTLSEVASDREAARLAAHENRSDILNGIDLSRQTSNVSSILIDLAQRDTMENSTRFADLLVREGEPYFNFQNPAHRFASLVVLKAPDTPSVLVETGYISNDADGAFLTSKQGQRRVAHGIAQAITVHFARAVNR
jgi:N-acetylmuramoyl-L-alanine amidase